MVHRSVCYKEMMLATLPQLVSLILGMLSATALAAYESDPAADACRAADLVDVDLVDGLDAWNLCRARAGDGGIEITAGCVAEGAATVDLPDPPASPWHVVFAYTPACPEKTAILLERSGPRGVEILETFSASRTQNVFISVGFTHAIAPGEKLRLHFAAEGGLRCGGFGTVHAAGLATSHVCTIQQEIGPLSNEPFNHAKRSGRKKAAH
jgi:hypothetical protein